MSSLIDEERERKGRERMLQTGKETKQKKRKKDKETVPS